MALVSPQLAGLEEAGQTTLDQPVEALSGAGQDHWISNGEGENVGLDPPGRRLDDVNLHGPGGIVSEGCGSAPSPR